MLINGQSESDLLIWHRVSEDLRWASPWYPTLVRASIVSRQGHRSVSMLGKSSIYKVQKWIGLDNISRVRW